MKENKFLQGSISSALFQFALPIILALFLQAMYGAVDLWAVGTFASGADMAAVSTASQVMLVFTSFITGVSMGITVFLGQKIGEDNEKDAGNTFGGALFLLIAFSLLITFVLAGFAPNIAKMAHAPVEAFGKTVSYLRICGYGTLFIVAYNFISAFYRGVGNSKYPLLFVGIAALMNMVGDVVLIKHFSLGATGAAIATVAAQLISVLLSIYFMKHYEFPFAITKESFKPCKHVVVSILKLGLPIAFAQMCNEIFYLLLMSFVNQLGVVASAGVGVAEKLIIFLVLIPVSFMNSISSFVATNVGAKQYERAKKGLFEGMIASSILGFFLALTLYTKGSSLALIFNDDPGIVNACATFLKATSLECFLLSIAYCFTGYFNGIGETGFVMKQGLFVIFAIKIPFAYYAMSKKGQELIYLGLSTVVGALSSLILCIIFYFYLKHKNKHVIS